MPNSVAVDLEDIDERDGWILDSRIDQQGGTEVGILPEQPLMSRILSSASLHIFLRNVDITQEISPGSRREIYHESCDWGWTTDMWVRNLVSDK